MVTATVSAQKYLNRNADEGFAKSLKTTDSTVTAIDSLITTSNEAGVVLVNVVGYSPATSDAVTGIKAYRYKVVNGTVTLGTVSDVSAIVTDSGLGTATFTISVVSNKIYLRVKGKAATTIYWRSVTQRKSIQKE